MNGGIGPEDAELGVEAPDDAGVVLPRPERRDDFAMVEVNRRVSTKLLEIFDMKLFSRVWNASLVAFIEAFRDGASERVTCQDEIRVI